MRPLPPSPDLYGGTPIPVSRLPRYLLPADLGFTHGSAWYSRAIRWATRHRTEPPTYANHTFGIGRGLNIVEALSSVRQTALCEWELPGEFEIFRHTSSPHHLRVAVAARAEHYTGYRYGALKILPHLLDGVLGKVAARDVYAFRHLCFIPRYPICSWLWAWAYDAYGVRTSACDKRYASPDDQHDFLVGSPEWVLVVKRFRSGDLVTWDEFTGYPVMTRSRITTATG